MSALVALTERMVRATVRDDLPFAIAAPAIFFGVFHLALQNVIDTGAMSYAQYLLPIIVVQVTFLGALTTIDRAVADQQSEFGVRLRTLPMSALTPLTARMVYCVFRGAVALVSATAVGYAFGFRLSGGLAHTAAFVGLALAFTLALSLGADALGSRLAGTEIGKEGTASQLLLVPQMLLIMVSTGMAPARAFPDWLHAFVRYQPVSQVTEVLRGASVGHICAHNLVISMAWFVVLLSGFGAAAIWTQRRHG